MTTRLATAEDAELIAGHRQVMFADAGLATVESTAEMGRRFAEWVRPKLADGSYVGWLAEEDGAVVGGAGMWVMDFPPHWMDSASARAYLLNFYTAPMHRGRGVANSLVKIALAEARQRGIKVVTLHASKYGRPIYEKLGFSPTTEMMLREE